MCKIELDNVSLRFQMRKHGRVFLKELLLAGMLYAKKNPLVQVDALKNINLHIGDGERLGVIGHNGAGKSTLLRLLAGIYPPTNGNLTIDGSISSMLELGVGVEPEASGWDNIALRSYLQGNTPAEVRVKRDEIAEFSELGEFLKMPVRFYSSGMMVRLAFSVATAINPEILLIDEVLSAGDLGFVEKARRRMLNLIEKARILVFVSHDLDSLAKLCNRAIWMHQGQIHSEGPPQTVIDEYCRYMSNPNRTAVLAA